MKCGFDMAYAGKCRAEAQDDPVADVHEEPRRCAFHGRIVCCKCGKPATRECAITFQFVCGAPLCDTCFHDCC